MTLAETKAFMTLSKDRIELCNFLHAVLSQAVNSNQRGIVNLCHRTLDKLSSKPMFIMPAQAVNLGV